MSAFAQSSTITTYVGPALPLSGQKALTQTVDWPNGIVPDSKGGFFFSSSAQNRVYRVSADGSMIVFAGGSSYGFNGDGGPAISALLANPTDIALDAASNLYIADTNNDRVRKVTPNGVISTVAGTGAAGFSGDGGPAIAAMLSGPRGVAVDSAGNLYIADTVNNRVRKVSLTGVITTVAGDGSDGSRGDGGPATAAPIFRPSDVAIDTAGNMYIAAAEGARKVNTSGAISTLVRVDHNGLFGSCRGLICSTSGVAVDGADNVYVVASGRVLIITSSSMTAIAGGGAAVRAEDIPATSANLSPLRAAFDAAGNLYITDAGNVVRKVTNDGLVHTVAGKANAGAFSGDGGPATAALLNVPGGVAADSAGNLYIADSRNNRIRRVSSDGIIGTFAGNGIAGFSGDGGPAIAASFDRPFSIAVDSSNNVYVGDYGNGRVRKVAPDGVIRTVAGGTCCSAAEGIAATSAYIAPISLAIDAANNLYIADVSSNLHRVRKVTPDGVIRTIAGTTDGFAGDGGPATSAKFNLGPIAADFGGNLYIADSGNHRIRKVTPDGVINTIAGNGVYGFSGDDGRAASAQVAFPSGLAVDAVGNLYFAVAFERIRKVNTDGIITTVAGNGTYGFSGDGGPADFAQLNGPGAVAIDAAGTLYIADAGNNRIRKVTSYAAEQPYSVPNLGARYWKTSSFGPLTIGYGRLQAAQGNSAAGSVAMFSYRSNGVLVSEAAVPATSLTQSGRIYSETGASVRTGIAIANPNDQSAAVSFYFTDKDGVSFKSGSMALGPNQQIAAFLDEAPFRGDAGARTFTFMSSVPVAAIALRGQVNERSDFLMTTLPVASLSPSSTTAGPLVLPHFATGGGWTTQILLVNPSDENISGTVDMDKSYAYSIPPRSAARIVSSNASSLVQTGMVRVVGNPYSQAPIVSSVFSFVSNGVTVTESGVSTTGVATSFRVFAEVDAGHSMQTGIALANTASFPATVQFELLDLNGRPSGYSGSTTINGNGHVALFLRELPGFQNLPASFRGVLRISSNAGISAIGLRERYNERGDFLISTTPAIADNAPSSNNEFVFPHLVSGGGYTTEFVLMSSGGISAGSVVLRSQYGTALSLQLMR